MSAKPRASPRSRGKSHNWAFWKPCVCHNIRSATRACRRWIEMLPLCQLEMTLSGVCGGKVVRLTSDEELSRLEERTAQEAVGH